MLVLRNLIFFRDFMPMSHGINKKSLPSVSLTSLTPYHVVTRYVCCFRKNTLSTFFWSDQVIAKDNTFSKKKNFFLSTHYLFFNLVLILLFCLHVFLRHPFRVLILWNYESIISRMQGFQFGLSQNHMT